MNKKCARVVMAFLIVSIAMGSVGCDLDDLEEVSIGVGGGSWFGGGGGYYGDPYAGEFDCRAAGGPPYGCDEAWRGEQVAWDRYWNQYLGPR